MVYRPRRPRRIIATWNCFNALIASLVLVLVLPVEAGIGVALTVPVLAATWFWSQRVYLEVGDDGVVIRNFWRTVEIPWRDVTAIEARRLFGSSRVDLCLWFDRRDGRPVPASVTQSPGPDGQPLIDALTRARNGARLPFSAPAGTQWHRKGSDSWKVAGI
jgi:Bacterial PH domain